MSIIKNLFVTWVGDFECDAKAVGLQVEVESHEIGGYMVAVSGPHETLVKFITEEYCSGMDDPELEAEIINSIEE